jgi:uncharacterized glyoxalase superfamily protein PhnB
MVHPKMIWPCLNYRDAPAAIAFLTAAFGLVAESIHHIVRELQDEPHGGRGFVVADPEGNLWSFGTYRGERR